MDEWLPQMHVRLTASTETPSLRAICDLARLASRNVKAVKFSAGMDGAADLSRRQFVLAGLAITITCHQTRAHVIETIETVSN